MAKIWLGLKNTAQGNSTTDPLNSTDPTSSIDLSSSNDPSSSTDPSSFNDPSSSTDPSNPIDLSSATGTTVNPKVTELDNAINASVQVCPVSNCTIDGVKQAAANLADRCKANIAYIDCVKTNCTVSDNKIIEALQKPCKDGSSILQVSAVTLMVSLLLRII